MTGKTAVLIPLWERGGASSYDGAIIVESAIKCKSVDEVYLFSDKSQTDLPAYGNFHFVYCSELSDIQLCISFAASHDFGRIVLLKKVSLDLNEALSLLDSSGADSLVSVTKIERKVFKQDSIMADDELYEEEGSLYIISSEMLLKTGKLISGALCLFKREKGYISFPDLSKIKMLLTDCDGCLTDGGMYYSEKGDELKKFNTKDGMAFSLLKKRGFITGIVTGEDVELNRRRVEKLWLDIYLPGCNDKLSAVSSVCSEYGLALENVAYIGDDINDLALLRRAGFSACPADAHNSVKTCVDYVAQHSGGSGVIREIADILLDKIEV